MLPARVWLAGLEAFGMVTLFHDTSGFRDWGDTFILNPSMNSTS